MLRIGNTCAIFAKFLIFCKLFKIQKLNIEKTFLKKIYFTNLRKNFAYKLVEKRLKFRRIKKNRFFTDSFDQKFSIVVVLFQENYIL